MAPFPHVSHQTKQEIINILDFFTNNAGMQVGVSDSALSSRVAELERKVAEQQSEIEAMQELVYIAEEVRVDV